MEIPEVVEKMNELGGSQLSVHHKSSRFQPCLS